MNHHLICPVCGSVASWEPDAHKYVCIKGHWCCITRNLNSDKEVMEFLAKAKTEQQKSWRDLP